MHVFTFIVLKDGNSFKYDAVLLKKRKTLRWFGHLERMGSEGFVGKVYVSETVGPSTRGRPLGRWRDKVKECTPNNRNPEI